MLLLVLPANGIFRIGAGNAVSKSCRSSSVRRMERLRKLSSTWAMFSYCRYDVFFTIHQTVSDDNAYNPDNKEYHGS